MSLTQFINWLFGNVSKVLSWFGDRFNIYVDILNNLGEYISGYIEPIRLVIVGKINDTKTYLEGLYRDTTDRISKWVDGQVSALWNGIQTVRSDIDKIVAGGVNGIYDYLTGLLSYVMDRIADARNDLTNYVNTFVSDMLYNALEWTKPLREIVNIAGSIIYFFSQDIQSKIDYLLNTVIPFVTLFIHNPVGFIFDILSAKAISVACYFIALALGTTKNDIDLTPPWKK